MTDPILRCTVIPALNEQTPLDRQRNLRQAIDSLRNSNDEFGIETRYEPFFEEQDTGTKFDALPVTVLQITAALGTPLGAVLGAWMQARYGRKVRIKIGDIEAEARTQKEVEQLLERALEVQKRQEPKKIHEP